MYDLRLVEEPAANEWADAVAAEVPEFALIDDDALLMLAFRFGPASEWSAAPFVVPARSTPMGGLAAVGGVNEERALLCLSVVKKPAQRVTLQRNWTLSLGFSRALNEAIRDRFAFPAEPTAQARALTRLAKQWPSVGALVARSVLRSPGIA